MDYPIYIIAAADLQNGIGRNNDLPWRLKGDLQHFHDVTVETEAEGKENMVVMGRKTWESLPEKVRPLKGRRNVVLTRQEDYQVEGGEVVSSLEEAFALADEKTESIFVIGGGTIYEVAMKLPELKGVYLTRVHGEFECDTFFPQVASHLDTEVFLGEGEEKGLRYDFWLYVKE